MHMMRVAWGILGSKLGSYRYECGYFLHWTIIFIFYNFSSHVKSQLWLESHFWKQNISSSLWFWPNFQVEFPRSQLGQYLSYGDHYFPHMLQLRPSTSLIHFSKIDFALFSIWFWRSSSLVPWFFPNFNWP